MSAFDLINGTLELLIVLACGLGSRAVIRRKVIGRNASIDRGSASPLHIFLDRFNGYLGFVDHGYVLE